MDCLNNLPTKDKLQKINFYGNVIKEVDFASLLTRFPKLQYLNVENNPVSAINLKNLSKEQLKILVEKIKEKKFRVNSYRGTVLQDLLFHLQSAGHTGHAKEIATMIHTSPQSPSAPNRTGHGLLIAGVIVLLGFTLLVGYLIGQKKQGLEDDD